MIFETIIIFYSRKVDGKKRSCRNDVWNDKNVEERYFLTTYVIYDPKNTS